MYKLRPASDADFDFAKRVKQDGSRTYVAQIWGWDSEAQDRRFAELWNPRATSVITLDDDDVGYIVLERAGADLILAGIYIDQRWRRQGVGSAVVIDLMEHARATGGRVKLQVLRTNPARLFYQRLSFDTTGETDTHLQMASPPVSG